MFTPIQQALGLEPGKISIELIERAVEEGVQETVSLDWRAEYYDSLRPGWDDEVAKDIAAMANSGGGWIAFGVAEEKETSAASKLKPILRNLDEHQRILRTAYADIGRLFSYLNFSLAQRRLSSRHDASAGFSRGSGFACKGNDAFIAPRRNGSTHRFHERS